MYICVMAASSNLASGRPTCPHQPRPPPGLAAHSTARPNDHDTPPKCGAPRPPASRAGGPAVRSRTKRASAGPGHASFLPGPTRQPAPAHRTKRLLLTFKTPPMRPGGCRRSWTQITASPAHGGQCGWAGDFQLLLAAAPAAGRPRLVRRQAPKWIDGGSPLCKRRSGRWPPHQP